MRLFTQLRRPSKAREVWAEACGRPALLEHRPSAQRLHDAALFAAAEEGNVTTALQLLDQMRPRGLDRLLPQFRAAMRACSAAGSAAGARVLLREMRKLHLEPDGSVYSDALAAHVDQPLERLQELWGGLSSLGLHTDVGVAEQYALAISVGLRMGSPISGGGTRRWTEFDARILVLESVRRALQTHGVYIPAAPPPSRSAGARPEDAAIGKSLRY
ncbi:unnamed protein product [Prorocentrum cordatum]|uniref:Pentacotripeptide-repeat region of PRORP domain-containing protein n=1 Tax=Prorocentrum cordatum TaxID=2364126 RepID=A0ABN9Q9Y0_9DINO|nr:unnamed protein product [Polarella glacialis]